MSDLRVLWEGLDPASRRARELRELMRRASVARPVSFAQIGSKAQRDELGLDCVEKNFNDAA